MSSTTRRPSGPPSEKPAFTYAQLAATKSQTPQKDPAPSAPSATPVAAPVSQTPPTATPSYKPPAMNYSSIARNVSSQPSSVTQPVAQNVNGRPPSQRMSFA